MKKTLTLLLPALFLFSFSRHRNDPYRGMDLKRFEKSLAYIPKGSFTTGASDEDTPYQKPSRTFSFESFYMYNHEVSNGEYCEFLRLLKQEDTAMYRKMLPDTLVWRLPLAYNEPYVEYYLRHPAYSNYPVVGVTHDQAEYYCQWLTGQYAKLEKRKFKTAVFRLPTVAQWEYAARGGLDLSPFPWGGPGMQNKKGEWLANFTVISQSSIGWASYPVLNVYGKIEDRKILVAGYSGDRAGIAGWLNDAADVTAPVISFYPNGFGLYNMAGNVEEYVAEKGITKGGSWRDTGYYLQNSVEEPYDSTNFTSSERGFRFIMEVKK
jgi:formylglycine-generating enzyme required for sulfatase activity